MLCVTTVQYAVCFSGTSVDPISMKWGLEQGDPLSPCLFLLRIKGLSKYISNVTFNGNLRDYKISPSVFVITHLLFADDSFLCFKDLI